MRSPRSWHIEQRERLFEHPLLNLERHSLSTGGSSPDRREALVLDTPDWVNVVAENTGHEAVPDQAWDGPGLLMVRQWRFGIASSTLEIPGGMVDPGESVSDAARRELLEETGYRAGSWLRLGQVEPNPALFNNRCVTFLAQDLERVAAPAGDGEEEIELVTVPVGELDRRVLSGEIGHALVIAAMHFYHLHRQVPSVAKR